MTGRAVRPLWWWTSPQLDALAKALSRPWDGWLGGWYGERAQSVVCVLAHEVERSAIPWHLLAGEGDAWAWSDSQRTDSGSVPTALFPGHRAVAPGSAAAAVERSSREALLAALAGTLKLPLRLQEDLPVVPDGTPWSGDVMVTLSAPSTAVRLMLNGACVAHVLGLAKRPLEAGGLPPVQAAVPLVGTRVSVELAGCEISLGALGSLAAGDILRLPHPLSAPLLVKVADSTVCAAHLGRRDRSRAIELLTTPSPS